MISSYKNLTRLAKYLKKYPRSGQPAAFEYLAADIFSQIFYLPLQTKSNEDNSVAHRVIWNGDINRKSKTIFPSPSGPDSICFAYGFYILIESTLRTDTKQWRREFVESLNHYDDFVKDKNTDKKNVYLVLIVRKLHKDTYTGFKQKAKEGYNIILLESRALAKICEICKIIFTARHLDIRQFFNDLVENLRESTSLDKFIDELDESISNFKENMCRKEKTVFFGLKSYEAITKAGRNTVGTSEILVCLNKDRVFKDYLKTLGGGDLTMYVRKGLLSERLACLIKTPDEDLFSIVNYADFKARALRLIKAVEQIK